MLFIPVTALALNPALFTVLPVVVEGGEALEAADDGLADGLRLFRRDHGHEVVAADMGQKVAADAVPGNDPGQDPSQGQDDEVAVLEAIDDVEDLEVVRVG